MTMFYSSPFLAIRTLSTHSRTKTGWSTLVKSPYFRTSSAVSVVGACGYYYYSTHRQDADAVIRAMRLFTTCVSIVADYKLAPLLSAKERTNDGEEWEKEYEARLRLFQEAQEAYTRSGSSKTDSESTERRKIDQNDKVKAKEDMEKAAEALAEAKATLTEENTSTSQLHRRAAQRILLLCQTNRGVYIKIGQHLANLDYLLPTEYIDCLQQLYNDNPTTPFSVVTRVLEEELGSSIDHIFTTIDSQPLASASLAQVHVATTKSGEKVAVKVQHDALQHTAAADMRHLLYAASWVSSIFPDCACGWLADEIAPHIHQELDFKNEGRNAERAAHDLAPMFGDQVAVPAIHWDYTTHRVLTMEYMEGAFEVSDMEQLQTLDAKQVSPLIASVLAYQIFETGFAHCDPHAANILVRSNRRGRPQIVLLDHGLYRELEPAFRRNYALLWKSLLTANVAGIFAACEALGVKKLNNASDAKDTYRLLAGVIMARPFDEIVAAKHSKNKNDDVILRGYAQIYLTQIVALLDNIPRPMLMMLKLMDCVRHLDCVLRGPDSSDESQLLAVTGRYAAKSLVRENKTGLSRMVAWIDYFVNVEFRLWLVRRLGAYYIGHEL